VPLKKDESLA